MGPLRLGDDIDDFCAKCKRLTNHLIVSMLESDPAKVRCRSCYNEHDFRNGEPPPKKEVKKTAAAQPQSDPASGEETSAK
jgi:hypothetical protein